MHLPYRENKLTVTKAHVSLSETSHRRKSSFCEGIIFCILQVWIRNATIFTTNIYLSLPLILFLVSAVLLFLLLSASFSYLFLLLLRLPISLLLSKVLCSNVLTKAFLHSRSESHDNIEF
jgi:hypothetical protein